MKKTILITGATDGIGKALAILLSREYNLALCGRSDEKMNVERVEYWVSQGALMSETVADIYKRAKAGTPKVYGQADAYTKKKNFKSDAQ